MPLHILYERLGGDVCAILPALHSLTGCDITSKIGTKKAALKSEPVTYLQGFGATAPLIPTMTGLSIVFQVGGNFKKVGGYCRA